jgi:magnesium transporter
MAHFEAGQGITIRRCTSDGTIEVLTSDEERVSSPTGTFLWIHIDQPTADVIGEVGTHFKIHPLAAEDMLNARQRTKVEGYGDSLFVVLRALRLDRDDISRAEVQAFLAPTHIVTVCHGGAVNADDVLNRAKAAPGQLQIWKIIYAMMDLVVDHLQPVASMVERRFELLEEELFEQSFRRERIEELYRIKRLVLQLLTTAAPVDDLVRQVTSAATSLVPADAAAHFRDIADHSVRLAEEASGLKEMIDAALNVNLALVTVGQNEIVKRLAGWGAVLAVPTMVFSLYGMNFVDMPELKWHYGYPAVLLFVSAVSWALYIRLRKVGWL